jgi:hypothetical protein
MPLAITTRSMVTTAEPNTKSSGSDFFILS